MIYEIDINDETEQGKKLIQLLSDMHVHLSPKKSISKLQIELLNQSEKEANNGDLKKHQTIIDEVEKWLHSK